MTYRLKGCISIQAESIQMLRADAADVGQGLRDESF